MTCYIWFEPDSGFKISEAYQHQTPLLNNAIVINVIDILDDRSPKPEEFNRIAITVSID